MVESEFQLPSDVRAYMDASLSECNAKLAHSLATFPSTHEESLDLALVSHFTSSQGPITFGSNWTLRFDAHYIGGGRHFETWEVADIGFMVMFRRRGRLLRSKLAFLQSKRLYAHSLRPARDPYRRRGMGRLLVTEAEHVDLVEPRTLRFTERSRYKALIRGSEQQSAMSAFANRFDVKMYYLFYNPSVLPWEIRMPVAIPPPRSANTLGCRVVPKESLDSAVGELRTNQSPSFADVRDGLEGEFVSEPRRGGWRLEHFVNDLLIRCKEGLVDESENFETMVALLSQKSAPISAALSVTFDMD